MDERELAGLRSALEEFAGEVFEGFARVDQRATGLRYLRGLMLDGRRKSMQPMAERLGIDYQQFQQFLTSSTWDYVAVRRRLAARTVEVVEPAVWIVDDTGFPKDGKASACVARQYSGTLGKVGNCQVAVSIHAASDGASGVLDWRLFVPESWDETCVPDQDGEVANPQARRLRESSTTLDEAGRKKPQVRKRLPREEAIAQTLKRRTASKIPDSERYRPKWMMALEMLDELTGWGLRPPVLVGDAGYGQVAEFRLALGVRDIRYVLATTSVTTAQPAGSGPIRAAYAGVGPRPKAKYPDPAPTLKPLALEHVSSGAGRTEPVRWRARLPGSTGPVGDPDRPADQLTGHFFTLRIRPAGRAIQRSDLVGEDGVLPECWLLVEWPPGAAEPSDYWLADLPADTPLATLVRLAKARWRIEHDYRELKTGLGLDHFEGRSWTGWHRHVTLTCAAQLFLTTLRANPPADTPKAAGQN